MANIDYEKCRKIGDSIYIQFTNGESWLIPLDDIVGDIEGDLKPRAEQREIAKLEIMLDVCKRDKDALRYQLEEAWRNAAQQSVHLTASGSGGRKHPAKAVKQIRQLLVKHGGK